MKLPGLDFHHLKCENNSCYAVKVSANYRVRGSTLPQTVQAVAC